jgi:hypothetical protein
MTKIHNAGVVFSVPFARDVSREERGIVRELEVMYAKRITTLTDHRT